MFRARGDSVAIGLKLWLIAFCYVALANTHSNVSADSLSPFVTGGVVDTAPQDGFANVFDAPFIANIAGGDQYRAIVEYDLSHIPEGTVLSASLTGHVGPNNSVDVGLREHLVEVYTGNGVVDLADYSVPGITVGQISHDSGDRTDFDFDFTGVLHNLLAAGADYIGMRITPLSEPLPFDVLTTSEFSGLAPRLNFEFLPEGAETTQLLPAIDFSVNNDHPAATTIDLEGNTIAPRFIDFAEIDRRGVLEYDLSSIPANADITDAKIEFDIWSRGGGTGDVTEAPMYGYSGDGIASISDAFQTATQIGILGPVDSLDSITVDIDHEFIEGLLGATDYFGIAILGDPDYDSLSFATNEFFQSSSSAVPAQLFLTYTVPDEPESSDFDGSGSVDYNDLSYWQSAFGLNALADADGDNDSDAADFLEWARNFSNSTVIAQAATQVPEPNSLLFLIGMHIAACRFRAN